MQSYRLDSSVILYGPNIHTGGGLVLLQELLEASNGSISQAFIAQRAKDKITLSKEIRVNFIGESLFSRLVGEWRLKKLSTHQNTVLCFHGLPPLFSIPGKVVVFAQNRLLFDRCSLRHYPFNTRLRIRLERLFVRLKHRHSIRYIVQTHSMASSLKQRLGQDCQLSVIPFVSGETITEQKTSKSQSTKYDFLYVASGEPHKNHLNLIEAWKILAERGLKPSLALTIDSLAFPDLMTTIEHASHTHDLNITNLGLVPHHIMKNLYASSGALIYPSHTESLGLPLIEAFQCGLPILASEKDFVRDTVIPKESFDPSSPLSIARAVQRFMGLPEPSFHIRSAADFLKEVMR